MVLIYKMWPPSAVDNCGFIEKIGVAMLNGIRQKATVGKGGRIEFLSPELPMGATVEIIVLIEKSPL
jgi:hypothetical protein